MNLSRILLPLTLAVVLSSCSSQLEMPKGSSKGYNSARLVQRTPNPASPTPAKERNIHGMIQNSIATQFNANGISFGKRDADLRVAYLVVYQETGMTTYFDEFYGTANPGEDIAEEAHERGVVKGKRRERYESAGLVIDILDGRSNQLVFRNYYKADIVRGTSDAVRAQRINAAVAQTLAPFFK